jgi:hypothetical protein
MSRLLYSERIRSYIWRRFSALLGTSIIAVVVVYASTIAMIHYQVAGRGIQAFVGLFFLGPFPMLVLLFLEVLVASSKQRFEISDDRIALPAPRHQRLFDHKPETILKSQIQRADLDYLQVDGQYKTRIPGSPDRGKRGEWRCTFALKRDEHFVLESSQVPCNRECVPALTEFIRELDERVN